MLYFANKPDVAFQKIVENSLKITIDDLKTKDEDVMSLYCDRIQHLFTREKLLTEIKKLLDAHLSKNIFRLTDYHFLVLYDIISQTVELHNDMIKDGSDGLFIDLPIRIIDFLIIADIYFWDSDFLFSEETFDNMTTEQKENLGISKETFGIVNELDPHSSELELQTMEIPEDWKELEIYKPNKDYPYTSSPIEK